MAVIKRINISESRARVQPERVNKYGCWQSSHCHANKNDVFNRASECVKALQPYLMIALRPCWLHSPFLNMDRVVILKICTAMHYWGTCKQAWWTQRALPLHKQGEIIFVFSSHEWQMRHCLLTLLFSVLSSTTSSLSLSFSSLSIQFLQYK